VITHRRYLRSALAVTGTCAFLLIPCLAQTPPKPDPAGVATGDRTTVVDAGGNSFLVPEPTDKSAPGYEKAKKEYDDFQAQAAKEPLAMKLADSVGHVRVGTNFGWTLNTGYLVLFMQAGCALLTLRAGAEEERRPPDDAQLRRLRVRVPGVLRARVRLSVRSSGGERGARQSRRHAYAQPVSDRRRAMGIPRRQRILSRRAGV